MITTLKNFKIKLTLLMLGFSGAFITTSMSDHSLLVDKVGYRFVSWTDPCHATKQCSTNLNVICKYGAIQLWGKVNEGDNDCPLVVYERQ